MCRENCHSFRFVCRGSKSLGNTESKLILIPFRFYRSMNLYIRISKLPIWLPNIKQRANKEAQSQQFDNHFKKPKSFVINFNALCEVETRTNSLDYSSQKTWSKLRVVVNMWRDCGNYWNDYWQQISNQFVIFQSFWASSWKLSVGSWSRIMLFFLNKFLSMLAWSPICAWKIPVEENKFGSFCVPGDGFSWNHSTKYIYGQKFLTCSAILTTLVFFDWY